MKKKLLKGLRSLTDEVGVRQHENKSKFGYAVDDQARALMVAFWWKEEDLQKRYLKFISRALGQNGGHHFYKNKGFKEEVSQEAKGLVLWALKKTGRAPRLTKRLKDESIGWDYPRPLAWAILGLTEEKRQSRQEKELVEKLIGFWEKYKDKYWPWFERQVTYGNAVMPWALWKAARVRGDGKALGIARKTTAFLLEKTQRMELACPIGNRGWYSKGGSRAMYDQQPVEAAYMLGMVKEAYLKNQKRLYKTWARKWWGWFWGKNIRRVTLVDKDWRCFDGIKPNGLNLNQGAESTIALLMAYKFAVDLGVAK